MESEDFDVELAKTYSLARQLERDISELSDRLIDRQQTLMIQAVKLQNASHLLTRCSASKQMSLLLQDDIRNFLKSQPSYRC